MENYHQPQDLHIMYVTADSFPEGIEAAFKKLERLVGGSSNREFFGLSKPDRGTIVYRAGVLRLNPEEATPYGLETYIMEKGNYITLTVYNFMDNIQAIGSAFQQLLHTHQLDPVAWCIERYTGNDVICMVKLRDKPE
ncbi:transcriptional regulator [Mucilaginibacter sp. PAMB04274]|uniref:transcriptional regulator n=1 Tax=Mucilaginibacter sp. PAMB04274 TaxID=3138568 RepID=UPI0031F6BCB1